MRDNLRAFAILSAGWFAVLYIMGVLCTALDRLGI